METYIIFKDKRTGKELCSYSLAGTFPGEREATIKLLAHEKDIEPEQIEVTLKHK